MKKYLSLPLFIVVLISSMIACSMFVGGPDYSDRQPVPVSSEAAQSLSYGIQTAIAAGASSGQVVISITEPQITSIIASKLQTDQNLQQDSKPLITDPQVYLRDGQMLIYGKTQQGLITANIGIVVSIGIDENGQPKVEIVSADFGPLPAPKEINSILSAMIAEAYTGSIGPAATGLRVETISIADGVMTITGRIK